MDEHSLVQPIVALNEGSHEDAALAVAVASLRACSDASQDSWAEWLRGLFTKTVRRMKAKDFQKLVSSEFLREELEAGRAAVTKSRDSRAVAFAPMRYSEFPSIIKRAQVSGFSLPWDDRKIGRPLRSDAPTLYVNKSLEMSTGKACAQVAHAYWIAALESGWDFSGREDFSPPNVEWVTSSTFAVLRESADKVVTDSGLTEFSGVPTETVLVQLRK